VDWAFFWVMLLYFIFLISFGVYQGRKVKSSKDFAIAGRKLPGWVAALSERATGESSWFLLGLPGFAYMAGLAGIWPAIGCTAGIVCAWIFLAGRLRREAERYDAVSFMDYLAKRHGELGRAIGVVGSFTIVFFYFFYVGAQFLGGGKIFNTVFGIPPAVGMIITLLIIVPYTVYGGFRSVAYTDVVQGILMIAAVTIAPIVGLVYISKSPDVFAHSISSALALAENGSITGGQKGFGAFVFILAEFSWFFGYLGGTPQITWRFMALRDDREAKRARNIGVLWTVVGYAGTILVGWIGLAIFGPNAFSDPETVMPYTMMRLFPSAIAALFITAALAALISSGDSMLILASTELTESILKPFFKLDSLLIARISTALIAVVALGVSYVMPSNLIYDITGYAWAGIGCTFSVVILFTLFWKRFNAKAVLSTIISGLLFTIFWITSGLETVVTARLMTFIVCLIVAFLATVLTERSENRR